MTRAWLLAALLLLAAGLARPQAAPPGSSGASDVLAARWADLGSAAFERGEYAQALQLWRAAEAALPAPPDPARQAELRYRQGRAWLELRRPAESAEVLRLALQQRRRLGDAQGLGEVLHALADAVAAGDEPLGAEPLYAEARSQRRAAGDAVGELRTVINSALLQVQLAQWGAASALLDEAGQAAARLASLSPRDRARWLSALGVARSLLGQFELARSVLVQAEDASRSAGEPLGVAEALRNQAFVALESGDAEASLQLHRRALAATPEAALAARAMALNGAGYALVRMERAAEALPLLEEAVRLQRQLGSWLELSRTLESLGSALLLLQRHEAAQRALLQSLALARQQAAVSDERETLITLGRLALATGQPGLAVLQLKLAVNASQRLRQGAAGLDRETRGALARRLSEPYKLLARLLIEQRRLLEAEQVLLALKDAEFNAYVRGGPAAAGTPQPALEPDERELMRQMADVEQRLAQVYRQLEDHARGRVPLAEPAQADLREREDDLLARQGRLLATLDQRLRPGGALPVGATLDKLALVDKAAALSAHPLAEAAAVLLFVPEERVTTVLITTAFGPRTLQLPVGLATLRPLILELRRLIADKGAYQGPARSLHQLLIEPVANSLASAGTPPSMWMLFVTDELRYLPFAALVDAQGRHLVETTRLSLLLTPAMDKLLAEPRPWRVSAFGSTRAAPAHRLVPLPAAREELRMLVRSADNPGGLLPGLGVLDDQFTRAAWQGAFQRPGLPAPGHTVVHVASHFKALPGDWNNSFLLLGGNEEFRISELKNAHNLSLRHVDLLTLSACATEINPQATGRELEGLGTLLLVRGAGAVIGTLWPVQDEGTSLWMKNFYAARGEQRQMSKAAAVQQAQLALLRGQQRAADPALDLRHPYYWAPFVLMGNWL